mmetsp:Transcript_5224/g.18758  ORF Transcript_5224/g.18758 Transcript_5224/m.18758 type:complete len:101 (+) Transcript_5224:1729-2031(+)
MNSEFGTLIPSKVKPGFRCAVRQDPVFLASNIVKGPGSKSCVSEKNFGLNCLTVKRKIHFKKTNFKVFCMCIFCNDLGVTDAYREWNCYGSLFCCIKFLW